MADPNRGEVWKVDLAPTVGHEQSGTGPALVISVDAFNQGPAELVVVLPVTSKAKGVPFHVKIEPPEGGLSMRSFAKCEDLRSISKLRLKSRIGAVSPQTMAEVEDRLRILLSL